MHSSGQLQLPGLRRIGVVGGGLMGTGIAQVCAGRGLDVVITELNIDRADHARLRIDESITKAVSSNRLSPPDGDQIRSNIDIVVGLDALADRQLIIECATEDEVVKLALFTEIDNALEDPMGVLASNTSSIPIAKLAAVTQRPDKVIGIHFFNPAPVQRLVEIIPSLATSIETVERVESFVTRTLGKEIIRAKDRSGFIVNALLVPYLLAAIRMLEAGHATAEDIDKGMVLGCAHPLGPLQLADLVGLETVMAAAESMHREYREPQYAPPALLSRMVNAGMLGRKSGKGFYQYS